VWSTPAGGGDVSGPASATANAVVLFDGATGKIIKDSTQTIATTNTASTVVARDASGNFSAGTITAALSGNATTATSATTATTATNQSGGTVSATSISDSGNLTFTGTGNRITGDFSNATLASRVMFQTSTTNAGTSLGAFPNGTGTSSAYNVFSSSDPANSSLGQLRVGTDTGDVRIASDFRGTGSYLPITFFTGGSERARIDTSGNVNINISTGSARLEVAGTTSNNSIGGRATYEGTIKINENNITTLQATGGLEFKTSVFGSGYGAKLVALNDGTLVFGNRNNSATWSERMRLDIDGNVGIGTSSPSASAILDAQSTTKGVRMPNMTSTQKNAISSPAAGLMVFDTTLAKLCVYSGSAWQTVTSI
jgi:hypothetical protein